MYRLVLTLVPLGLSLIHTVKHNFGGLVKDGDISIANALDIAQSYALVIDTGLHLVQQ